mgnify:CR=1 FL=1
MREIKFRGVTTKGETVYGDLEHFEGNIYINDMRVNPETVAQFCGVDENDTEIFEGDAVVAYGKDYEVRLVPKYGLFYNLKCCIKKI